MDWKDIETAPKDGRVFFVWDERAGMPAHCRWVHEDTRWHVWLPWAGLGGYANGDQAAGATHWCELPPPPNSQE